MLIHVAIVSNATFLNYANSSKQTISGIQCTDIFHCVLIELLL